MMTLYRLGIKTINEIFFNNKPLKAKQKNKKETLDAQFLNDLLRALGFLL